MKTRKVRRIVSVILLAVLFLAVAAPSTEAAVKKVKTQAFSTQYTKALARKASTVKTGTNTLQIAKSGYVKFVVPKTKKYTFTYTGMSIVNGFTSNGFSYICLPEKGYNKTYLESQKFTTTGGKTSTAWYGVKKYASKERTATATLATRTAKLRLKKGTTVYIYFSVGGSATAKLNLKIK